MTLPFAGASTSRGNGEFFSKDKWCPSGEGASAHKIIGGTLSHQKDTKVKK
jgi:hypothetical protein